MTLFNIPDNAHQVKFASDRYWWTIRARDDNYVILTRPEDFAPKGTHLRYTIIDRSRGVRGPVCLSGGDWNFAPDPDGVATALLTALNQRTDGQEFRLWVTWRTAIPVEVQASR